MRLINTATGLFEEFIGSNIPRYAILSHTWGDDEVSFSDMQKEGHQNKNGFEKIRMTCKMAAHAGIPYAWVDTCCIDKSSSAELTEAINSMYRWYQRSAICYAYLSDLDPSASLHPALSLCRWFTRGWTLQELIAPYEMRFFNCSWADIGSKHSLCDHITRITGIDIRVLRHQLPLSGIAVAQRMAWAAKRETTRIEDRAYSLLGIFGVHMPMIYGEEERAFRRLQEEIIKTTPDLSIFAWRLPPESKPPDYESNQYVCGLLASSPDVFGGCLSVAGIPFGGTAEFSLSNKGIKFWTPFDWEVTRYNFLFFPLRCTWNSEDKEDNSEIAIRMKRCSPDEFVRCDPWDDDTIWSSSRGILKLDDNMKAKYFLSDVSEAPGADQVLFSPMLPFLAARRFSKLNWH